MKKNLLIRLLLVTIVVSLLSLAGWYYLRIIQLGKITSYDLCAAAGYQILESYPEVCKTPDGRNFIHQVDDQQIEVAGTLVCLPHRDTSGPQTLECAYGLKDSTTGYYYGLTDNDTQRLFNIPMNTEVNVVGKFVSAPESKYATIGTISVTSITVSDQPII